MKPDVSANQRFAVLETRDASVQKFGLDSITDTNIAVLAANFLSKKKNYESFFSLLWFLCEDYKKNNKKKLLSFFVEGLFSAAGAAILYFL